MGKAEEFLEEIRQRVAAGQVSAAQLQAFLRDPGRFSDPGFDFTCQCDSLAGLLSRGGFDRIHRDIRSENFPLTRAGAIQTSGVLVSIDQSLHTLDIEEIFRIKQLRPASMEELLSFGSVFPDIQRQVPIVGLGSVWTEFQEGLVVVLNGNAYYRGVDLGYYQGVWSKHFKFLGIID